MNNYNRQLTTDSLKSKISTLFANQYTSDKQSVGIEIEFTPFKNGEGDKGIVTNFRTERKSGILDVLKKEFLDHDSIWYSPNKEGVPRFLTRSGGTITFEPGGQLEYSSTASSDFSKIVAEVSYYISQIHRVLSKRDIWFFFGGLNPWYSIADIGLQLRKERYIHMDRFLGSLGVHGQRMMRLSSSTQVNLDVGHEETMVERWLAGNLLAPIMIAIFGNTPFLHRKRTEAKSYRSLIWQNLDSSRTGIVSDLSSIKTKEGIESAYFDFAMNAKVIMLPDSAGKLGYRTHHVSFKEWNRESYSGIYPSADDWEYHLTTLFPNVRPKGFFEFRYIDGQSHIWWLIPTIMLSQLLYDCNARKKTIDLLLPYVDRLSDMQWRASIMGISAFPDLCRQIVHFALQSHQFEVDDTLLKHLELFAEMYPLRGKNPADDLLSLNHGNVFTASQYRDYEAQLFDCVEPPESLFLLNPSDLDVAAKYRIELESTLPVDGFKPCC